MPFCVSLQEAVEAVETCGGLPENKQDECYVAFGVDKESVTKYLHVIQRLEKDLTRKSEERLL